MRAAAQRQLDYLQALEGDTCVGETAGPRWSDQGLGEANGARPQQLGAALGEQPPSGWA